MWVVPVEVAERFRAEQPKLLFHGDYTYGYIDWSFNYAVHPDGGSFLMVKEGPELKLHVLVS